MWRAAKVTYIYYDWARIRETGEDGVLMIRPDKHIGWRSMTLPRDPEQARRQAPARILSH
jgi:2,4-dichlorophenol 6-monooxygenase